jgi:hypothetical protein
MLNAVVKMQIGMLSVHLILIFRLPSYEKNNKYFKMIFRLGFLTFLYKYKEYYKQIKKLNNLSFFQCFNFLGLKIIKNILRMTKFQCKRYDLFFLRNTHELLV